MTQFEHAEVAGTNPNTNTENHTGKHKVKDITQ